MMKSISGTTASDGSLGLGALLDGASHSRRKPAGRAGRILHLGFEFLHDGRRLGLIDDPASDGDRGQAVAAPDQRLFELVAEGRDRGERDGLAVLARKLQVLERLDRLPLGGAGAAHHVDEIDRVAHLGDAGAPDDAVERAGDILRGDAELAGLVLQNVDLHDPGRLVPVEVDVADPRVFPDERRELLCELPHPLDVGPADAVLHGASSRRTDGQEVDIDVRSGKLLPCQCLELVPDTLTGFQILGDDHHLPVIGDRGLRVEREDEPHRAAADIG